MVEEESKNILSKEYRWSNYTFLIDMFSFTTLVQLIALLMAVHKAQGPFGKYPYWVIGIVAVCLEILFGIISVFDSRRPNPKYRLFNSKIFNLPVYTITVIIITIIFMNTSEAYAIIYGAICGGFAGYLAGGLAYANFFIHIKDDIYRIIFG